MADAVPIGDARPDGPRFGPDGLITAVVQDRIDGSVLMVAHMNDAAWNATLATREATFWSRSRQRQWRKGETSGNVMRVADIRLDCDGDTVLLTVDPAGPACHTGARTCFDGGEVTLPATE